MEEPTYKGAREVWAILLGLLSGFAVFIFQFILTISEDPDGTKLPILLGAGLAVCVGVIYILCAS